MMGDPFRSNQGSSESIYIWLSYASYPAHMHGHVPGIDVKRWWEGNMTKCCCCQWQVMHLDCPRGQKEVYIEGFHIQITLLACVDAFPKLRWKCCWNAKITNFVIHDNRQSILVDPGVKRKPIRSASICKMNWMHTWSCSDDIPKKVSIPLTTMSPTTPSILLHRTNISIGWNLRYCWIKFGQYYLVQIWL